MRHAHAKGEGMKMTSQDKTVMGARAAIKADKHWNGHYNDEVCWAYLRRTLPNASDEYRQAVADRVELALTR